MSYEQVKQNRKNRDTNVGNGGLSAERGEYPCLCDGLDSCVGNDPDRSTLAIQLYCRRGRLFARIEDREDRVQLFVEIESLSSAFDRIERELQNPDADWSACRSRNTAGMAR